MEKGQSKFKSIVKKLVQDTQLMSVGIIILWVFLILANLLAVILIGPAVLNLIMAVFIFVLVVIWVVGRFRK